MTERVNTGGFKTFVYNKGQEFKLSKEQEQELKKAMKIAKLRIKREEIESRRIKNKLNKKLKKFLAWIRWNIKWVIIILLVILVVLIYLKTK